MPADGTKWRRRLLLLKTLLATTDGRDKTLKVVQYSLKVYLWLRVIGNGNEKLQKALVSQLSLTRRLIRLGHLLEPLADAQDALSAPPQDALNVAASLVSDIADDVLCLGKLGLVGDSWMNRAGKISDRAWLLTIFLDLAASFESLSQLSREVSAVKVSETDASSLKQLQHSEQRLNIQRISTVKLLADLLFCSIDVLDWGNKVSPGWQATAGLTSALLGTYKLVYKLAS